MKNVQAREIESKKNIESNYLLAKMGLEKAKKDFSNSYDNWQSYEKKHERLQLQIEDIKKYLETESKNSSDIAANIAMKKMELKTLDTEVQQISVECGRVKASLEEHKDKIYRQNQELSSKAKQKDDLLKKNQTLELEIKKQQTDITKAKNENKNFLKKTQDLEERYAWILEDSSYFGVKNTRYDYGRENPINADKKLKNCLILKEEMSRTVNEKAMILLEKEEEMYTEVINRRKIVEDDKKKIMNTIAKLDEKKKRELKKAWQQVDSNFGAIFGSLLPGAQAKLVPINGQDFLNGLEVKVGFNGLWKDSLTELSGGQRSLVALSIILAMLKYKPAPLYILDEVDAALDLSHTQNIGTMLKHHFTNSQFIIVSLKDGMFNNANVLFRTKFVDGMSAVVRTTNSRASK